MATLITKTLKKDGSGDYTTFSAFCAGEAANLVSLDQIMRLEIYKAGWDKATPLTENFVEIGNNFTTDATRYVEFYVPPAERHGFTEDTGFVMTLNTTYGLVFRNEFVVVDGIEFYNLSCSNTTWFAQSNALFKNCLLYDAVGANIRIQKGENCIAYNYPTLSNSGVAMFGSGSSVNCTAIIIGGAASYGGAVAVNSGVINDSLVYKDLDITTFDAYFSATGDYNGVNRTGEGVPGANSQTNLTSADFNDYANKDFRLSPTSAFVTNGTGGGFMGAAVAPSSGISIAVTLGTIEYNSNDTAIGLAGAIDVTATLGAINYSSNDTVIQVSGDVNVIATLGAINYASNDTAISLFGNVDVTATLGTIDYNSNDASVSLLGGINVNATLGAIDYTSNDTTITLQGQIALITTLGTISYDSNNVTVQIGTGQIIGNVTAGFADNLYSAGFKPSEITVNFKT